MELKSKYVIYGHIYKGRSETRVKVYYTVDGGFNANLGNALVFTSYEDALKCVQNIGADKVQLMPL